MNATCPVCQRDVYSRRRNTCGHCGADFPLEAVFSPEESSKIAQAIEEMEARRQREQEAEEKKKRRSDSGGRGIYGPGVY